MERKQGFTLGVKTRDEMYETLVEWWLDWGFPSLPYQSLPNTICTVSDEEGLLYAIPLYLTDSDICWIGFPTGNKKASKERKEMALEELMYFTQGFAKNRGYGLILTTSDTPKLMKLFKQFDFVESDQGTNFYTKRI